MVKWTYGITTVPSRKELFHKTLASLRLAGFSDPHVFMDGPADTPLFDCDIHSKNYGLLYAGRVSERREVIHPYGNWLLALLEMFIREPHADRYAIFQDDIIMSKNVRPYLDTIPYEPKTYWNLMTFPVNAELQGTNPGWYSSNQWGRSACGLVFDHETTILLLSSRYMIERPMTAKQCFGKRNIDGAVITVLKELGYRELCHNPSFIQHVGHQTSMGSILEPNEFAKRESMVWQAPNFRGEDFDCLSLLKR